MTPFMLISALVTSYMCYVEGPCRMQHWINHGARRYIMNRLRYLDKAYHVRESPCSTPNGRRGSCVSLYDCQELMVVVNKPNKSQQDLQLLKGSQCGYEGNVPKVCCPDNTCTTPEGRQGSCINIQSCPHLADMLKPPVSRETIAYIQRTRCNGPQAYSVCCGPPPSPTTTVTESPIKNGVCTMTVYPPDPRTHCCGIESMSSDRITGGNVTTIDQYPWLALIEYVQDNRIKLLCGAALISGKYVLTAGHCVKGAVLNSGTPRNVRLGEYDTSNDGEDCALSAGGGTDCNEGTTIIPIEEIIAHPEYNPNHSLKRNDIALIRLRHMAPYTEFIRPICLPTFDITSNPPFNLTLFVAGWGAINETHSKSSVKLDVAVPYRSRQECQPAYDKPRRRIALWEGQMCAGGEAGKDSCKGDSGGPLMYDNNRVFEIVGIVSFGTTPCGIEYVPGVYTKVFEYNTWIRSQMRP